MGQGKPAIPEEVYICSYNKYSFNDKLDVIRDAHDVSQYYANLLLLERLPIKLDLYKNYSDHTEEYFNPTRKNVLTDLGMSYYNFYQYINSVPELYGPSLLSILKPVLLGSLLILTSSKTKNSGSGPK